MLKIESHSVGPYQVNAILVWCEETLDAVLFDPGAEPERLLDRICELKLKVSRIINTHGHMDHIAANADVKTELRVPLLIHPLDRPKLTDPAKNLSLFAGDPVISPDADGELNEGDEVTVGNGSLKLFHVPGHSPGSLAFYCDNFVVCGDALFCQGIGRTDFPDSNETELYDSIREKLYTLPEDTVAYPGHGPTTTIGYERRSNPFVRA